MKDAIVAEWTWLKKRNVLYFYWVSSFLAALMISIIAQYIVGLSQDMHTGLQRTLFFRNLFLSPLMIFLLTAQSISEPLHMGLIKEILLLPISKTQLICYKILTLTIIACISILLTVIPSVILLERSEHIAPCLLSVFLSLFCDITLIAIAALIASTSKSSIQTILGCILVFTLDISGRFIIWLGKALFGSEHFIIGLGYKITDYFPGNILLLPQFTEEIWGWHLPVLTGSYLILSLGLLHKIWNSKAI